MAVFGVRFAGSSRRALLTFWTESLRSSFIVGANRDEHPLVEDVRSTLDGLVRRSGFVCSLLEVRTADALFQIGVDLEVVSDVLQFVSRSLLVLRRDVRCEVEFDVGQLEEVAQIAVVRVIGVVSDVQRRRPLLADACGRVSPTRWLLAQSPSCGTRIYRREAGLLRDPPSSVSSSRTSEKSTSGSSSAVCRSQRSLPTTPRAYKPTGGKSPHLRVTLGSVATL